MAYSLFQAGEFDAATISMMTVIFEEVCAEMRLSPGEDKLRDLIAFEIKICVQNGQRDVRHIRNCARKALQLSS